MAKKIATNGEAIASVSRQNATTARQTSQSMQKINDVTMALNALVKRFNIKHA